MPGHIDFRYDEAHDVVIADVHWLLATDADLDEWEKEYRSYFERFDRKVDVIYVLNDFEVRASVGSQFGELRARLLRDHVERSYRVKPSGLTTAFMHTSRVLHDAPANEFTSVAEALEALATDRAAEAP